MKPKREKNLYPRIKQWVKSEKRKSFRASDIDFLEKSPGFLAKHEEDNGNYTPYFKRLKRGLYELIK